MVTDLGKFIVESLWCVPMDHYTTNINGHGDNHIPAYQTSMCATRARQIFALYNAASAETALLHLDV